jgi:hypothetical protein
MTADVGKNPARLQVIQREKEMEAKGYPHYATAKLLSYGSEVKKSNCNL